jgi:hypothetical protein
MKQRFWVPPSALLAAWRREHREAISNRLLTLLRKNSSPDISRVVCCDRVSDRPSGRLRVSDPATYCSSAPRIQLPAVARYHSHLHGLATAIHETSGLEGWHLPSAYARPAVLAGRRSIGPKVVAARAADVASLSSNMGQFYLL